MKYVHVLLFVAVFAFSSNAAAAWRYTGNKLLDLIEAGEDSYDYALALGYVSGTINAYGIATAGPDHPWSNSFCFPRDATFGQAMDVVHKYLKENPEHRHQGASALIFLAIRDAFPCEE